MLPRRPRKSRLKTACLECQRRKQKCDQNQPCSYCMRRFPPVQCIYVSATGRHLAIKSSSDSTIGGSYASDSRLLRPDTQDGKYIHLTVDTFDSFGRDDSYQQLLSSMVSRVVSERADSEGYEETALSSSLHLVQYSANLRSPSNFSISRVDPLHFLGITPTNQSGELLQAFIKIISKYPFSIDGNPSPNYYNDHWIPWSMKSPLLVQLGIFTASCYQAEAQGTPPTKHPLALRLKLQTISLLNDLLTQKDLSTSNEVMTGVVYLAINEWYWSSYDNVQAHLSGLREMVRLRGGLGEMGMNDFPRKMILLLDYWISCSYGCQPSFPHNINFIASQPANMITPLQYSQVKFTDVSSELHISTAAATILDDMRFLIHGVTKQVHREPEELEKMKLTKTSLWIRNRISNLPDGSNKTDPLAYDYIYKSCRIAALIYCKAIVERIPLSRTCTMSDLQQLWSNMWRITLTRWKEIPGIFLFLLLSANQAAQTTPHGRFVKSMFKAASSYMALDNWDVVDGALANHLRLQKWLGDGRLKIERSEDPGTMAFLHIYET